MRTTVVLKDDLVKKAKKLAGKTTLSALLNNCLADWIAQHGARELKIAPIRRIPSRAPGVTSD